MINSHFARGRISINQKKTITKIQPFIEAKTNPIERFIIRVDFDKSAIWTNFVNSLKSNITIENNREKEKKTENQ